MIVTSASPAPPARTFCETSGSALHWSVDDAKKGMATKTLHHSDALDHTLPLGVSHSSRLKDGRARPTGTKRRRLSET